jgi:hypothetical protein
MQPSLVCHPAQGRYLYKVGCIRILIFDNAGAILPLQSCNTVSYLQENDWHFVFHMVLKCIESSVLLVEEMTDGINDAAINQVSSEDALEKLKLVVGTTDKLTLSLAESALVTMCHLNHLCNIQEAENSQSEAIAKSCSEEASSVIGSSRHAYLHFWELVASFIKNAPLQIRKAALESMELC